MTENNEPILLRECEVTVIPSGETTRLPEGTAVNITHRLGGNFTVVCDFGMFRINGQDADAIGEEIPEETKILQEKESEEANGEPPSEETLWEQLKSVYDPEIPVNIVDLGLIYSLDITTNDENKHEVRAAMTLTSPGCGMGPAIAEDAKNRLLQVNGISEANVDIVWDPPWHQEMISEAGKMELGLI